jgi:glycosyltransferase involved in cell wall biosynthesis
MKCPPLCALPTPPADRTGWPWTVETPELTDASGWPRITIVTPSLNQAEYLEETIRSILLQGYPDLEYFVIDGGSTDGSVDIIRRYAPNLAGWASEPDRGQSHALNKGFARASGQVHAFLNSDDRYEPGALQAVATHLRHGHRWVAGQVRFTSDGGAGGVVPQQPDGRFTSWFLTCPVAQPGSFWTAELHRLAGSFREDYTCLFDYEFWLRMRFDLRAEPAPLDRTVAVYRLHPQSKSSSMAAMFAQEAKAIRAEYIERLNRGQRARLWLARRHRKARWHGSRVIPCVREGRYTAAAGQLLRAFGNWPLLLFDRGIVLAARQWTGRYSSGPAFPDLTRDWDD